MYIKAMNVGFEVRALVLKRLELGLTRTARPFVHRSSISSAEIVDIPLGVFNLFAICLFTIHEVG